MAPTEAPTFGPQQTRSPPTIAAYIREAGLDQTETVEWFDPRSKQVMVITDTALIQRALAVLVAPPSNERLAPVSQEPLLLIFNITAEPMTRAVSMNLDLASNRAVLKNVATGSWPVDLLGQYPITTGEEFLATLGIPPTPE